MKNFIAVFITILLINIFYIHISFAQEASPAPTLESSSRVQEIQNKINDLQGKISDLQGQKKTLSSQIAVMDNQVNLTQLKIQSIQAQISELTLDIDTADKKIDKLESSLDKLSEVLINRIKQTYVIGSSSQFQILLSSNDMEDFVKRANYLRLAQAHDKKLIYDTVQARNDYETQKEIFQDQKSKTEILQNELENYQAQLDSEKAEKATLLAITQNDENKYQQELVKALAEQRAISGITSGGGTETSQGSIIQGDVVGAIISGASPCSSGTHLHFEVKNNGGHDNPSNYLSDKSVIWNNSPDGSFGFSGSWNWPIADQISINQGYGHTAWSNIYYGGGQHTGLDMHSTSSNTVKAVKSGTLYKGSISCGGGQLNYARVDHGDGMQSYYLHIY